MWVWPPSSDVHAHQVATGRAALAGATAPPLQHVVVELGCGLVVDAEVGAHDVVGRLRLLTAAATAAAAGRGAVPAPPAAATGPAATAPATTAAATSLRCRGAVAGRRLPPLPPFRRRRRCRSRRVAERAAAESPIRGVAAPGVGVADLPGAACGVSPASSSATSATSSVVMPRSAAASV